MKNGRNAALNGGRGSGQTVRRIIELYENKIADLKANCDLAIEGRDIKIKELEQKLEQTEKDLADYQFNYPTIKELEKEKCELLGIIQKKDKVIEKMKCCQNCEHHFYNGFHYICCDLHEPKGEPLTNIRYCPNWELKG